MAVVEDRTGVPRTLAVPTENVARTADNADHADYANVCANGDESGKRMVDP